MIKVGKKVRFDPYKGMSNHGATPIHCEVVGTIVYVHKDHRYFTAEYETANTKFKTSFKFDDVYGPDKSVYIVKE